jgi:Histidine kinase-, DNA gyrase B-, and HSP90-like ATPase
MIDKTLPFCVGGDALLLQKILEKLLLNAIKYSDQGNVTLKIELDNDNSHPDGIGLHLEVVDQGIGIPVSLQAEIFDRFATSDAFQQKRQGGAGLGLTLCKQIVTMLGGTIGVQSLEGQGSTFWCDIPFKEASLKEATEVLRPLKILFLDTVHPLKFQWVAKLMHWGMDVDVVRDMSAQSLKDIDHKTYDCVLIRAADVELAEHYKHHLKAIWLDVPYVMIQMPPHVPPSDAHDWFSILRTPLQDDPVLAVLSRVSASIERE